MRERAVGLRLQDGQAEGRQGALELGGCSVELRSHFDRDSCGWHRTVNLADGNVHAFIWCKSSVVLNKHKASWVSFGWKQTIPCASLSRRRGKDDKQSLCLSSHLI